MFISQTLFPFLYIFSSCYFLCFFLCLCDSLLCLDLQSSSSDCFPLLCHKWGTLVIRSLIPPYQWLIHTSGISIMQCFFHMRSVIAFPLCYATFSSLIWLYCSIKDRRRVRRREEDKRFTFGLIGGKKMKPWRTH